GQAYLRRGEVPAALAAFDRAVEADPIDSDFRFLRANARVASGNLRGAIDDLTTAIEINPEFHAAWHNRGMAHADLEELQDALADFTEAIRLDVNDADPHNGRG